MTRIPSSCGVAPVPVQGGKEEPKQNRNSPRERKGRPLQPEKAPEERTSSRQERGSGDLQRTEIRLLSDTGNMPVPDTERDQGLLPFFNVSKEARMIRQETFRRSVNDTLATRQPETILHRFQMMLRNDRRELAVLDARIELLESVERNELLVRSRELSSDDLAKDCLMPSRIMRDTAQMRFQVEIEIQHLRDRIRYLSGRDEKKIDYEMLAMD